MRRRALLLVLLAVSAVSLAPLAHAGAPPPASALVAEGYVLIAEERGVKVYRRERRAGIDVAAEATIAASPERVRRVLTDYAAHGRWQKHLKETRILARGEGSLDVYQRLKPPVIDDRDYTLHVTWGDDAGVAWVRFAATSTGPAPVPGVVRIREHDGAYRLAPANGGAATNVVYRFYIDMAGSLPAWAIKGQVVSDVPDYFANLTKQLPAYP
jgi:hypothetical protein